MDSMKQMLQRYAASAPEWVELRYHHRRNNRIQARAGRVDSANSSVRVGVGVRALANGCYGFASTDELTDVGVQNAVQRAIENAKSLSVLSKSKIASFPKTTLATSDVIDENYDKLLNMSLAEKVERIVSLERQGASAAQEISLAVGVYTETFEDKIIVTSDGAYARKQYVVPELSLLLIAKRDGEQMTYHNALGVQGDWNCLFNHHRAQGIVENTAKYAVDLLSAGYPNGGRQTVIMSPSIVGLLSHEAIGHTVEADFVASGSVAKGRIGTRVGSELITMCDSGESPYQANAAGSIPFDDEGVPCQTVKIIEGGILRSFLHSRESAVNFGVEPTGNARAWAYTDEPLIRMRNTYVCPGERSLEEIIADTKDGLLLEGAGSGQADSTGEFMFGIGHAVEIKNGKRGKLLREVTISGIAFDVLQTVDAVSSEFRWDLGSGYCGKGQAAKVDAGGPYLRAKATVGGR